MSSSKLNSEYNKKLKFTKGEKCIYLHLVVTFVLILILLIIYFTHLCLVNHTGNDYYRITRRFKTLKANENTSLYLSIGIAYLNITSPKIICNTLLLKHHWSIAPAHCVLIRSNPKFSFLLQYWKLRYKNLLDELTETNIKNGHTHSYFNSEDFENNIGVFEHVNPIYSEEYKISNIITENSFENMVVVGWTSWKNTPFSINKMRPLTKEKCSQLVMPIIDQKREAEFCVVSATRKDVALDHGAVIVVKSQTVGFFSWGDKYGKSVPFVILKIAPFKDWLEFAISL